MKPHRLVPVALFFAVAVFAAPVSAQLYKWVDDNGATHYSDRKPDDLKTANKVKSVEGVVSVYSPDKTLLQAVETAREKASRPPEIPVEPERTARLYMPPPPAQSDPCAAAPSDCGEYYYYPYAPAYATRRHWRPLKHAVLPPGAIAGTVHAPGIIPGNTGTTPRGTAGHLEPRKQSAGPRPRPRPSHRPLDPQFRAR